jgi:hypothetical protein
MYFNLDNPTTQGALQSWVIVTMRAQGRYSVDGDATTLGNGCTPPMDKSEVYDGYGVVIGPAPNANP